MAYLRETENYVLLLTAAQYSDLVSLVDSEEGRWLAPLKCKFKMEYNFYVCEIPKPELCAIVLKLHKLNGGASLCFRLIELAKMQDSEFQNYYEKVAKDLSRFN